MAHTTNYVDTFIEVAEDCPADHAMEPPVAEKPSIAATHYRLIAEQPYARTSDDVIFETYALRNGIAVDDASAREAFFSKGQPCLRSSPLGKRYGWGLHHDAEGRVALVPRESEQYAALAADTEVAHTRAMRSRRA
ncbi:MULTISPECIES: DUF6157 family protein [unclassified Microbacterium]|uniref:DUF6157 family protein n=1 Tax=unclassified Microbacterium TaxID=2609290 RepID=UPI000CFDF8DF|nr:MULTISPECIES: DUF6157 family protein [unclassified Microbacterium]PQZ59181.1 hypothetical protein CQ032_06345 [Microbacterium sp. MYb43]PQZ81273.1 hypothetical protein CQ031_05955 [Microbacterium sp. MYb40]PRB21723.1 hypothetical protein CQ040_07240 [Microbacterium sp. MYb54]PRB31482.1 hypothetical protein CQ037_02060 [Microbacterium sp. MYb50]PRB68360.1 hypothetical protein CQ021_06245 [Microbacterium sp. MYb24]